MENGKLARKDKSLSNCGGFFNVMKERIIFWTIQNLSQN